MHTFDNTLRAPCSAVTSMMFLPTKYCSVCVILKIMNKRRGGERERGREGEGERGRGGEGERGEYLIAWGPIPP